MEQHGFSEGYAYVKEGILKGTVEDEVHIFRGVPYAKPPVGELRWRDPEPPAKWFGVRPADRYSAGALQWDILESQDPFASYELGAPMHSEDCLYMNIFSPAQSTEEKLPIFVWVHGGGMVAGSGMATFFEGEKLAKEGMIVAVINYRLGLFGFFCHPELSAESPHHSCGNYGILDIRQAVKWLKENARAFGGDPDRITVGGQSGGSLGTTTLALSPLMEGLCQGYIMESGCPLYGFMQAADGKEMERKGEEIAKSIGAPHISDLRAMDGCDLIKIFYTEKHYIPNFSVDGYVLPDTPWNLLHQGKICHANLLLGVTSEEFGSLAPYKSGCVTAEGFETYLKKVFTPEEAAYLGAYYPHTEGDDPVRAALRIQGDIHAMGPMLMGKLAADAGRNTYVYYKTRPDSGSRGELLGSTHSSELPFLFDRPQKCIINPCGMDEGDIQFGKQLRSYWANFIQSGDPNVGSPVPVEWKAYKEMFDYLDLGREIHQPSEEEKEIFRYLWAIVQKHGECTVREFQTADISPVIS